MILEERGKHGDILVCDIQVLHVLPCRLSRTKPNEVTTPDGLAVTVGIPTNGKIDWRPICQRVVAPCNVESTVRLRRATDGTHRAGRDCRRVNVRPEIDPLLLESMVDGIVAKEALHRDDVSGHAGGRKENDSHEPRLVVLAETKGQCLCEARLLDHGGCRIRTLRLVAFQILESRV